MIGLQNRLRRRDLGFLLLVAFLPVVSLADVAVAQDTVTLSRSSRRGSKLIGRITSVSPTSVTVESGGNAREVPANEIQRINLAGEPNGLRQARTALLAGQYEQALESLQDVSVPGSSSELMKQEVEYHRLFAKAHLALRGEGDARETASQLFEFLRRERNTYHFFPAVELIGDLSVVGGDYANAAKYYQQLSKAPWPDYQMRSFVLIGDALRLQGDHAGALRQYDQALGLPANEPLAIRQQTLSRIGRAACVAETGSAAEAQRELEDVIAKNDPSDEELFAQAYLALGTAYRKADQSMDAVLAYLHIDLLFYSQRTAHAEALYRLTELWPKVEQPARAVETRQLLLARYPGTVWAKRANQ